MSAQTLAIANLFGAFNGLLLGLVLLARHRRQAGSGFFLGLLLVVASTALSLITLEHQGWIPRRWWVYSAEEALTLLSGPLLVSFVCLTTGRNRPGHWIYLPVLGHALAVLVGRNRMPETVGIEHLVWIQMGYTMVAVAILARGVGARPRRLRPATVTAAWLVACIIMIHVAQIVRMLFSELVWVRDVVPLTGTVFFYLLLAYALLRSRVFSELPVTPGVTDPSMLDLFAELERHMRANRPWADPDLDLAGLAAIAEHPPHRVSAAISAGTGESFYDYLARYRVEEAMRLLADPAEARFTIEGIARQSGFGSRSGFYKLFKARTGQPPTEFRRKALSNLSMQAEVDSISVA